MVNETLKKLSKKWIHDLVDLKGREIGVQIVANKSNYEGSEEE